MAGAVACLLASLGSHRKQALPLVHQIRALPEWLFVCAAGRAAIHLTWLPVRPSSALWTVRTRFPLKLSRRTRG